MQNIQPPWGYFLFVSFFCYGCGKDWPSRASIRRDRTCHYVGWAWHTWLPAWSKTCLHYPPPLCECPSIHSPSPWAALGWHWSSLAARGGGKVGEEMWEWGEATEGFLLHLLTCIPASSASTGESSFTCPRGRVYILFGDFLGTRACRGLCQFAWNAHANQHPFVSQFSTFQLKQSPAPCQEYWHVRKWECEHWL